MFGQPGGERLPSHLVPLPGSAWAVWRWIGVRGAGFPADWVLKLADSAAAAAATHLLATEEKALQAQDEWLHALQVELTTQQHHNVLHQAEHGSSQARVGNIRQLERLIKRVKHHQMVNPDDIPLAYDSYAAAYHHALGQAKASKDTFVQMYQAALLQISHEIRSIAKNNRFQEAIIWQNRQAFHRTVTSLLNTPASKQNYKTREREEFVASYIQRYCVKNDSIGFFGPVGWAQVDLQQTGITVCPSTEFLASRTVYFEDWCIKRLADAMAEDESLQPWFVPRRLPFIHVEDQMLWLPVSQPTHLSRQEATLLQACDGYKTTREIASELRLDAAAAIQNEAEVYQLLKNLCQDKRIVWTLEVPTEGWHPERQLRQRLEQVEDQKLRQHALNSLTELETCREAIAKAAGNADQLHEALEAMESTFARLTSFDPRQRTGEARSLVYEDCRRNAEVKIGADVLQKLARPLSLLLTSARWFTYSLAQTYRQAFYQTFQNIYKQFGQVDNGVPTITLSNFWLWIHPLLFGEARPADALVTILQERWFKILLSSLDPAQSLVRYTSEAIQAQVLALFNAPHSGWKSARYYSPDLLVAASSTESIQQGDYQFVLGELHLGGNTLGNSLFLSQHPFPEEFLQATQIDLPEPRILPVASREWSKDVLRAHFALMLPKDIRLLVAHDTCYIPNTQTLPVSEFVVEEIANELTVRSRDRHLCFDVIDFFSEFLSYMAVHAFKLLPLQDHIPRIMIDDLVVQRETWRFSSEETEFAYEEDHAERFVTAQHWRHNCQMPRFVFVSLPTEPKPIYVDFDSPIYVNILARLIRKMTRTDLDPRIIVTEMLPSHEHIWLPDATNQYYTSELRMVVIDTNS